MLHYRELGGGGEPRHEWLRPPFRETARIVCTECNSGWMSELESAAKPLLEAPILRKRATYGTPQRVTLARWAFKTALVFQASQTEKPMAPPAHFASMRQASTPPAEVAVWIGSHYRARHDASASVFVQRPLALQSLDGRIDAAQFEGAPFGFLNFLGVGGVSFVIVGHGYANQVEFELDGPAADGLIPIWPHIRPVVSWPPEHMMDQQLLGLLTLPEAGITATIGPPRGERT